MPQVYWIIGVYWLAGPVSPDRMSSFKLQIVVGDDGSFEGEWEDACGKAQVKGDIHDNGFSFEKIYPQQGGEKVFRYIMQNVNPNCRGDKDISGGYIVSFTGANVIGHVRCVVEKY